MYFTVYKSFYLYNSIPQKMANEHDVYYKYIIIPVQIILNINMIILFMVSHITFYNVS